MSKSVKVGDYYNNDDNGVWSWYLANLRAGDFEELIGNKLKYTLLKRFLNKNLLSNTTDDEPVRFINKKLLFVSIPEDIHQNISILELFLRDYFHLQNLNNIQISKLTDTKVYNHENHYFLMDEFNNFEDPTFLELGRSNWKTEGTAGTVYDPSRRNDNLSNANDTIAAAMAVKVDKLDSENSNTTEGTRHDGEGHSGLQPTLSSQESSISCTSSLSSISSTGADSLNEELRIQQTIDNHQPADDKFLDHQSLSSKKDKKDHQENGENTTNIDAKVSIDNNNSDVDTAGTVNTKETIDSFLEPDGNTLADTASSIVLNFAPAHKRAIQKGKNKLTSMLSEKYPSDFYTPPQSELVSINSFGSTEDYTGQSLKLMITKNKEEANSDEEAEGNADVMDEMEPICELSRSVGNHDFSNECSKEHNEVEPEFEDESGSMCSELDSEGSLDDMNDSASDLTLMSILPSISIFDTLGYFRLVLQSIIIQDPESREIFTAIRQSNNKPTIADITDDWLLYDSDFSMGNLQILSLQDIMDIKRDFPKILFYTMVSVNNRSEIACEFTHSGHDFTKAPTPIMTENEMNEKDREDNDHPAEIQDYFPNPQSLTAEDLHQNGDTKNSDLQMAERTKSNITTTHRSIRTVNSIGDWPLDVSGGATRTTTNTSYIYDGHDLTLKFDESSKDKMYKARKDGSGGKYSKNYLTKVNTNGSNVPLDSVERTKSLPLPTLLRTLSNAEEQQRNGSKSRWKFRSMKRNKKKSKSSSHHHNSTHSNGKKDDSGCSIM